ncbi:hypothetical protein Pmani_012056 [Petrolisthes manimaculis]|uniref:Uncharacterized protein n=1 Tax=Petrolisthes manimaculis TaxID=1843537 RepID=A0AAE1PYN7_9EUCA|nr:hypothetical protein Pmani_012056 [Petrolisthes manimaculis]
MSVSSVEEQQQQSSSLVPSHPLPSPPPCTLPPLLPSSQRCPPYSHLPGERSWLEGTQVTPIQQHIWSVSSHQRSKGNSGLGGSQVNSMSSSAFDNHFNTPSHTHLSSFTPLPCNMDATCAVLAKKGKLEAKIMDEISLPEEKLEEMPLTEYIVVDIPLQIGMGSPYSSSCFILIDR